MKVAFYTSTLGDQPVHEVIQWAKQAGFDGIEIDVNRHLSGSPGTIIELARSAGLDVPSITLFADLLHSDQAEREKIRSRARAVAKEAINAGVPTLVLFPGRNEQADEATNYEDIAAFLTSWRPLALMGVSVSLWNIEHEDREYAWPNGDVKTRKKGFVYGLSQLQQALAG